MKFLADKCKRKIFIITTFVVFALAIVVGACAAYPNDYYRADNAKDYEGLILLGSYSTADLSTADLTVLSVFGSEDEVMNYEKYNENKSNLPSDYTETVIDGGCHAYFGMYGAQDGEGTPTITNEEQIRVTVENIVKVME